MPRRLFHAFLALILILVCGIACYLIFGADTAPQGGHNGVSPLEGTAWIAKGHLLEPFFREPFESSMMIYGDLFIIMWSTHDEHGIAGTANERAEYLKSINRPINTVMMIIHNHQVPGGFSGPDQSFYRHLKALGFEGAYGIYQTFNQTLLWLPESLK